MQRTFRARRAGDAVRRPSYGAAAHASCGAAFCNVNTNWSLQGVWTQPGLHVDLRFEYIDQDQPMNGSRKIAVGEIPAHHDEVRTINRNLLTTFDYGFNANWGVTVVIPVVDRSHEHIHNHRGREAHRDLELHRARRHSHPGTLPDLLRRSPRADRAGFAGATLGLGAAHRRHDDHQWRRRGCRALAATRDGHTQLALSAYYRQALPIYNSSWYAQAGAAVAAEFLPGLQARQRLRARSGLPLRRQRPAGAQPPAQLRLQGPRQGCRGGAQRLRRADTVDRAGCHYAVTPGSAGVRLRRCAALSLRQRRAAHCRLVGRGRA